MVNKGGFSFVAMLVINPIVILFYQNCSIVTVSHATQASAQTKIVREIASEKTTPKAIACDGLKESCRQPR